MKCADPYMRGVIPCGCGKCLPCKVNRRRLWAHRIMLESFMHDDSCFLTLTYNEEKIPEGGTLCAEDTQKFIRRLRKSFKDKKIRYYLAGEYGSKTWRPHYHLAVFGLPGCEYGRSKYSNEKVLCCGNCENYRSIWGNGNVYVGELNPESASYIGKYMTKTNTFKNDPRLKGKKNMFCRMSLKPGIGADAMNKIALSLDKYGGTYLKVNGDVPAVLRHGKKMMPLGRYLRSKLREKIGWSKETPKKVLQEYQVQMQELLGKDDGKTEEEIRFNKAYPKKWKNKEKYVGQNKQNIMNFESRFKIFNKEGNL